MMTTDVTIYMGYANQSIEKQEYRQFIEDITCALYLSNNAKEVMMLYANGLMEFGDFKKAFEVISDLLRNVELSERDRVKLLQRKAIILCGQDEFRSAEAIYKELCQNSVLEVKIKGYSDLGWIYLYQYACVDSDKKYLIDKAVNYVNKAVDLLNDDISITLRQDVLMNFGTAYWYKEEYSQSLEAFKEVYNLSDGKNTRAMISIAEIYICLGDFELASEHLSRAEVLDLSDSYQLGHIHLVQGTISYLHHDLAQAREYVMLAYDDFVREKANLEAGYCMDLILYLDYVINSESIGYMVDTLNSTVNRPFSDSFVG